MIKTIKVQLKPNNKQNSLLFECAGVARWAYNWTLNRQQSSYEQGGTFISNNDLRKELTKLKKTDELRWLSKYSNNITKQAIKDACHAYQKFFTIRDKHYSPKTISRSRKANKKLTYKELEGYPNFKSKKRSRPAFYQDNVKIKFTSTHVFIEKLGKIKLVEHERIPVHGKYFNPRITFDGLHWSISIGIEMDHIMSDPIVSEPVDIDVRTKAFAVSSTGIVYKDINQTKAVQKANQRLNRLRRQSSRQRKHDDQSKRKNELKLENKINKASKRLHNLRMNYIHQITSTLVRAKPMYIRIEDVNPKEIMKNKYLATIISNQKLYEFKRQLEYKCLWYGVSLQLVDQYALSSNIDSYCKHRCDSEDRTNEDLNTNIDIIEEYPYLRKVI